MYGVFALKASKRMTPEDMKRSFQELDKNHNGLLEYNELSVLIRSGNPAIPESQIEALFDLADPNDDGFVNFDEFVDFLTSAKGKSPSRPSSRVGRSSRPSSALRKSNSRPSSVAGRRLQPRPCSSQDIKRKFHEQDKDRSGWIARS